MSSAVATLEEGLQAMLPLKPPGVRSSIINNLRDLCVNNIKSESVLIQKLYTHFKKAPGTHKLGVLYVVDLVSRKWSEQAKSQGQEINSAAADGTFAAGVNRITELLPVFLQDTIDQAPEDQKEKIKKLIDIWAKYETFSAQLLDSFRSKLESTTPVGSPPASANIFGVPPATAPPAALPGAAAPIPSDILASLASLARPPNAVQQTPNSAAQMPIPVTSQTPAPAYARAPQGLYPHPTSAPPATNPTMPPALPMNFQMPGGLPFPPASQPGVGIPPPAPAPQVAAQAMPFAFPPPAQNGHPHFPGTPPVGISNQAPVHAPGAQPPAAPGAADAKFQQQLALVQALMAQGIPVDQITQIVTQLAGTALAPPAAPIVPAVQHNQYPPPAQQHNYQGAPQQQQSWAAPNGADNARDQGVTVTRSPNQYRGRSRSRSPTGRWGSRDTRGGRDGRIGEYGRRPSPNRGRPDSRDGGYSRAPDGGSYRQRSPDRRGSSPPPGAQKRWIEHDPSVPADHIKVYSRTLFVGGVTCSETRLREIFSRFGKVQTCIVNTDKRHAFVKMYDRPDAVKAKAGMETLRDTDMQLRTRWGVGFGPRDCSDYQSGVSVIPIARLTPADCKWMLSADFGGTGGLPIEGGMAVEEPDIEIGAGVSSKAISRRMQTDRGGRNGPRSSRDDEVPSYGHGGQGNRGDGGRFNRRGGRGDNHNFRRNDDRRSGNNHKYGGANNSNGDPGVAEFPFGLETGPNGMPIFPPGFTFPAQ